jgi:conjugative transposon TraM protein
MDIVQKLKKLNLKQPKYVFPLIVLLPLLFLGYTVAQFFSGSTDGKTGVVTDSINMSLPDARSDGLDSKMAAMDKHFSERGAFSAVNGIGDDVVQKDTTGSGYNEEELARIQQANAERLAQQEAADKLQRSYAENSRRLNGYSGSSSSRSSRSQQDDLNDYARELENIQNRSMERQRRYYAEQERKDKEEEAEQRRQQQEMIDALTGNGKKKSKANEKTEVVEKVKEKNAEQFNTVTSAETVDEPLIKAMIDKTTKAREGTRLRFKLLDDVTVKGIKLKKGSYLYGIVTGFSQQRVMANITSILVGNKFIKVNLSVFDNDGMEGFYVPESTFREMVKDASASVANQSINFDTGGSTGISAELLALQALQNVYRSTSSAVSNNIRKNKARIKYNTIVYLINSEPHP